MPVEMYAFFSDEGINFFSYPKKMKGYQYPFFSLTEPYINASVTFFLCQSPRIEWTEFVSRIAITDIYILNTTARLVLVIVEYDGRWNHGWRPIVFAANWIAEYEYPPQTPYWYNFRWVILSI